MKLQHLAIIFVLIIVPISLVMSSYIQNQIEAINMQTKYDMNLISSTYDAVKAFQINTTNNKYSSISDSKIRDIEASVSTFYNSLISSMSEFASREEAEDYVPAMLFTLYDGYYIYSSFDNVYSTTGEGGNEKVDINLDSKNYQKGLQPYVYYSAKYKLRNGNVITVNYTLDNAITVYGDFGDGEGYVTRTGYLINPDNVEIHDTYITYNGVRIEPEILTEHLITIEDNETKRTKEDDYRYIFYQNEKIYQDYDENGNLAYNEDGTPRIFWYHDYMKTYINDPYIRNYAKTCNMRSMSAIEYYARAKEFSDWVKEKLGGITQADTLKVEDGTTPIGNDTEYLAENTGNSPIFEVGKNNDPLVSDSIFNNHRLAIIRKSIETSLNTVISKFRAVTLYDYAMPVIDNEDWYKILNNISMVTFMQGIPMGYRYYNNYAVITNNVNKEVVKAENIYIVTEDTATGKNREYHQPGCKELISGVNDGTLRIVGAYPTASFQRQSVKRNDNQEDDLHFYLQAVEGDTLTGCYNCIVNSTADYDTDDIIEGIDLIDFENKVENGGSGSISFKSNNSAYMQVRAAYLKALARERYDIYKSNFDLEANR